MYVNHARGRVGGGGVAGAAAAGAEDGGGGGSRVAAAAGIFTIELGLNLIAYGVAFHRHSFLRDVWCQLDLVVVGIAWLPILFPAAAISNVSPSGPSVRWGPVTAAASHRAAAACNVSTG